MKKAEIGNVVSEYEYIRKLEIRQKNCKKGVNKRKHGKGEQEQNSTHCTNWPCKSCKTPIKDVLKLVYQEQSWLSDNSDDSW
jgi:hypothetical protein